MERRITDFTEDEAGVWVAVLECGHRQHVRHDPPWQNRPWVMTPAGRAGKLGAVLDCRTCDMAVLPQGLERYHQTPTFTEDTIPSALRGDHRTKPGVWAEIVVEEGKLEYQCGRGGFVLTPRVSGVVEPEASHRVRPIGSVRFFVAFLRARGG
jgi:tellurite methyltransferase